MTPLRRWIETQGPGAADRLAARCGLAVRTVYRYSTGERHPTIAVARKLAAATGVPLADLVDRADRATIAALLASVVVALVLLLVPAVARADAGLELAQAAIHEGGFDVQPAEVAAIHAVIVARCNGDARCQMRRFFAGRTTRPWALWLRRDGARPWGWPVGPSSKRGKAPPEGAIPCGEADDVTGHHPHWIEVTDQPHLVWHREAWAGLCATPPDGTYELCGPKLQGNPQGFTGHLFIKHGAAVVDLDSRSFDDLHAWMAANPEREGLVFCDGERFAKIRRADFGLQWPPLEVA